MKDISRRLYVDGRQPRIKVEQRIGQKGFESLVTRRNGTSTRFIREAGGDVRAFDSGGEEMGLDDFNTAEEDHSICGTDTSSSPDVVLSAGLISTLGEELVFHSKGDVCFAGDAVPHSMSITLFLADDLIAIMGSYDAAVEKAETVMAHTIAIYEFQFNIILQIKAIGTKSDIVDIGPEASCFTEKCGTSTRLDAWTMVRIPSELSANANILLAGCSSGYLFRTIRGVAYVGQACGRGYQKGTMALYTSQKRLMKDVYVFAHELGHICGAPHPTKIDTPGIMGYKTGYINGDMRFDEATGMKLCNYMRNNVRSSCLTPYDGGATPPPPPVPPPPTPPTPPTGPPSPVPTPTPPTPPTGPPSPVPTPTPPTPPTGPPSPVPTPTPTPPGDKTMTEEQVRNIKIGVGVGGVLLVILLWSLMSGKKRRK